MKQFFGALVGRSIEEILEIDHLKKTTELNHDEARRLLGLQMSDLSERRVWANKRLRKEKDAAKRFYLEFEIHTIDTRLERLKKLYGYTYTHKPIPEDVMPSAFGELVE